MPSPYSKVEDTIASPKVFYIPVSLSKSCLFFRAHFPLLTIYTYCVLTAYIQVGITFSLSVSHVLIMSSQQNLHALSAGTMLVISGSSI